MNKKFSRIIIALFVVFIMSFSVLEFALNRNGGSETVKYGELRFVKNQEVGGENWILQGTNFYLNYSPSLFDNVNFTSEQKNFINNLKSSQKVYFNLDYNNSMQAQSASKLYNYFNSFLKVVPASDDKTTAMEKDIPLINCQNSNYLVILFKEGLKSFKLEGSCLYIYADTENDSKILVDKILIEVLYA